MARSLLNIIAVATMLVLLWLRTDHTCQHCCMTRRRGRTGRAASIGLRAEVTIRGAESLHEVLPFLVLAIAVGFVLGGDDPE